MAIRAGQLARRLPRPARRVLGPTYRVYDAIRSRRDSLGERRVETDATGLPLPPPRLRRRVAGWAERDDWLRSGEVDAGLIRALVERHGERLEELTALLDFGCGCGRIARWWRDLDGPDLYGCDYNKELIRWCQAHLPFIDARLNGSRPPLPFDPGMFDLVYAISLFSHLPAERQREWLDEVRRILKPGGLFLFTVMGGRFLGEMEERERRRFSQGELVVRYPEISGANVCSAFHPPQFVLEELLPSAGFELVELVDEDLSGQARSASPLPLQDNYLVRIA